MCSFTISSTLKCVELALLIHCNLSSISLYSESINAGSLERKRQFAKHVSKLNESYLAYFKKSISSDPSAVMIRASQGSYFFLCLITFEHAYVHLSVNPICFFFINTSMTDALDYLNSLENRYMKSHGVVMTWGNGDCGQLGHGIVLHFRLLYT